MSTAHLHRWSGWPGAFCLKCGCEDRMELAIADGVFEPYSGEWVSIEAEKEYAQGVCSVSDAVYEERKDELCRIDH